VDAGSWLPLDTKSANFDNIADAQALSPTLLESYLNAAAAISRLAVGDRHARPVDSVYTSAGYVSQHPWNHVEGAPFGTRGGMVVEHVFPADGEYVRSRPRLRVKRTVRGHRFLRQRRAHAPAEYEPGPAGGADGRRGRSIGPSHQSRRPTAIAAAFVRVDGPYKDGSP
jgi:hypothetical protein